MELTVYNVLGQRVTGLVDEWQVPGEYRVQWDGGEHGSGVYFRRLKAAGLAKTIKMVLLK